jgi:FkbM family methyltransferase
VVEPPFVSYSQNREDVVLARALRHVERGRYVDIGANDPIADSVTYAFYLRGWTGITVEPVPAWAQRQREARPNDTVIEAAITADDVESVTLHHIADTGLSTLVDSVGAYHQADGRDVEDIVVPAKRLDAVLAEAGWDGLDIHFMVIDTEGAERSVLESVDLRRWRPWILVVEATKPQTTEPSHDAWEAIVLDAGYRFCLFDGLSRFYVAAEREQELGAGLAAPANILDNYVTFVTEKVREERDQAVEERRRHDELNHAAILEWRSAAVRAWSVAAAGQGSEELRQQIASHINHIQFLEAQLAAVHHTVSWRVTKPLREVRHLVKRSGS